MKSKLRSVTAVFGTPIGSSTYARRSAEGRLQEYHYLVLEGDEPAVGDLIITSITIESGEYPVTGKIARVTEVHDVCSVKATKFYMVLLSRSQIAERQELNKKRRAAAIERARITQQLELKLSEQSARERFERLAASDPEAAALLAKLEEL